MLTALQRVQRTFPHVEKVLDSKETITVDVIPEDSKVGRSKDPAGCALVKACIRQKMADGAIIGIGFSYLIKGNTAIRFKTSQAVAREITTYDRHNAFAPGEDYKLSKVSKSSQLGRAGVVHRLKLSKIHKGNKLGKYHVGENGGPRHEKLVGEKGAVHRTSDIRVVK